MKLLVEYDGTDFHGFQVQPDLRTVQGVLQDALLQVTGESIVVDFAGRTDAGVHAIGQVVSFPTGFRHGPEALRRAMTATLPKDVAVREAVEVDQSFHARRSARSRWYRYTLDNGETARPLLRRQSHFYPKPLDVNRMNTAAKELIGTHDFWAFGDVPGGQGTSVRRVYNVQAQRDGSVVWIDLVASAFLRRMARSMVGLLLRIGSERLEPTEAGRVLREKDRQAAGPTAPAMGLCLMGVNY